MPKSKFLILTIGSNTKQRGGEPYYNPALSITSGLSESDATFLKESRNRIYRLIKKGGVTRHKKRLEDLPSNRGLVHGPEFGGTSADGLYLPAARRFRGRFFKELDPNDSDLLIAAPHHVLIITGLYGLVPPSEPIQDHNCHIDDHPIFRKWWTEEYRLTKILLAYIRQFGITHILDFTAQDSYRFLIAWEKVRAETKAVFHCFGEQTVGPEFLIPLGALTRELLLDTTEQKVLSIRSGTYFDTPYERVYFHPSAEPPANVPQELRRRIIELNSADETVRMGRCIRGVLHTFLGDFYEEEIPSRIKELAKREKMPSDIEQYMISITKWRNKIEHTFGYSISSSDLQSLRNSYAKVKQWVQDKEVMISNECIEM